MVVLPLRLLVIVLLLLAALCLAVAAVDFDGERPLELAVAAGLVR